MRCPNPRYVWPQGKVIAVPCGKCLFCLQNKRDDWSMRLLQEWRHSDGAMFVTLTYSEKWCPKYGLDKSHVQKFLKRLRKNVSQRIRYYAVGEYGGKTLRPHYHLLLFNITDPDPVRRAWTLNGSVIGIVDVRAVNEGAIRYCTKYVVQKGNPLEGLTPPFALASRAYGLGAHYLTDEMVAWHREDDRMYAIQYGQKVRLPRFYKDKIWPNVDYSNFKYLRKTACEKAVSQAEEKERKEVAFLRKKGYNPEAIRDVMRKSVQSRIKVKVAHSQFL